MSPKDLLKDTKALVNILDDTYEQFNDDRASLSAALFQISNMDI